MQEGGVQFPDFPIIFFPCFCVVELHAGGFMAWGRIPPSGVNRFKLAHGNEENDLATFLENK